MNRQVGAALCGVLVGCAGFDEVEQGGGGAGAAERTAATTASANTAGSGTTGSSHASSSTGIESPAAVVTVVDKAGTRVPDVLVFSNDVDGNLTDETVSDEDGIARLQVVPGGSVSVAREVAHYTDGKLHYPRNIMSQHGLGPGSEVTFRVRIDGLAMNTPKKNLPMKLTMFAWAPTVDISPANTRFGVSCNGSEESVYGYWVIDKYSGCAGKNSFGILATSYDKDGALIAAGSLSDLPLQPETDAIHTVEMLPVIGPATAFEFTGTGAPDEHLTIALFAEDALQNRWSEAAKDVGAAMVSLNKVVPLLPVFKRYGWVAEAHVMDGSRGFMQHSTADSPPPTSIVVQARSLAAVRIDSFDGSDPEHLQIAGTIEDGPQGDFVEALISWGGQEATTEWRGVSKPGADIRMMIPELPASLQPWLIQAGDVVASYSLTHLDTDVTDNPLDAFAIDYGAANQKSAYAHGP